MITCNNDVNFKEDSKHVNNDIRNDINKGDGKSNCIYAGNSGNNP